MDFRYRHIITEQAWPAGNDVSGSSTSTFNNRYTYLELPLFVQVDGKLSDKVNFLFSLGGSASKLIKSEEDASVFYGEDIWKIKNWLQSNSEDFYMSGYIASGISYSLTPKVSLTIDPTFNISLKKQELGLNNTMVRPYSFGIKTGFTITP